MKIRKIKVTLYPADHSPHLEYAKQIGDIDIPDIERWIARTMNSRCSMLEECEDWLRNLARVVDERRTK